MHCIHLQVSDFDEVCGLYRSRCYRRLPFVIEFIVHLMCASAALSVAQAEAFWRDGDEVCDTAPRRTRFTIYASGPSKQIAAKSQYPVVCARPRPMASLSPSTDSAPCLFCCLGAGLPVYAVLGTNESVESLGSVMWRVPVDGPICPISPPRGSHGCIEARELFCGVDYRCSGSGG
jgi:hypothetical protein